MSLTSSTLISKTRLIVEIKWGLEVYSVVKFLPGTHETLGSIPSTVRAERAKRLNKITVCHIEHHTLHVARRMVTAHCSPKQTNICLCEFQTTVHWNWGKMSAVSISRRTPAKFIRLVGMGRPDPCSLGNQQGFKFEPYGFMADLENYSSWAQPTAWVLSFREHSEAKELACVVRRLWSIWWRKALAALCSNQKEFPRLSRHIQFAESQVYVSERECFVPVLCKEGMLVSMLL